MNAVHEAREPSPRYLAALEPPLLGQFDLIAQAPNGVARLRELILTLAVQGKLVPQDQNDEPASILLERIRAEKARSIKVGKIKKDKPVAAIAEEEKAFDLPSGWEWVRGADIYSVIRGVTYQKDEASNSPDENLLPILRANNIRGTVNFEELVYVPKHLISAEQTLLQGDFIVCLASGSKNLVGKVAVFQGNLDCSFGAFCGAIRTISKLDYLGIFFASPLYRNAVSAASAGIGINNLKSTSLLGLTLPLPPLAEQTRIVARVEELMALCDALEAKGKLEAEQHARMVGSLFESLANSESAHELVENWQRIATHFDLLLDRPAAVDALEQTILQLAVRGLLVPQDPAEESASALLQKTRHEKERLIAAGKIRRDKPLQPFADKEKPFELPKGWQWVTSKTIFEFLNGYAFKSEWFKTSGIRLLRNINVSHGFVDWSQAACIDPSQSSEYGRFSLNVGDIVLSLDRPLISTGLKYAVIRACDLPCLLLQRVAKLTPEKNVISPQFAELWLNSELFTAAIDPGRSNGVPHISTKQLEAMSIALPPLAEQLRIVSRISELRGLCTQLRERLKSRQQTQSLLAEALIEKAVA